MRSQTQDVDAPTAAQLSDKALVLRRSVNSSRARMSAQKERLERLRTEIEELRALVEKPHAPAAHASSTLVRSAPIMKEDVAVSAAATSSLKTGARADSWKPVPYIAIFFVAVGMQLHAARAKARVAPASVPMTAALATPAPALDDDGAAEALLLAHDWRLPGDELPLSERLGGDTNPPGTQPEWTAERTGERTYRVSYRANRADVGYDFDVDLTVRRVDPTPETAELISPRLAFSR